MKKLVITVLAVAVIAGSFGAGALFGKNAAQDYAMDDVNKDGHVDLRDFSLFLAEYPKTAQNIKEVNDYLTNQPKQ